MKPTQGLRGDPIRRIGFRRLFPVLAVSWVTATVMQAAPSPAQAVGAGAGVMTNSTEARSEAAVLPIDLPTAMRLVGAGNLEVRIAEERVREAKAVHEQTRLQYFPWLAPALGYRAHAGNIQDVAGNVFEADKQAYTAGLAVSAQVNLGEAIYQSLAARQRARAAEEGQEARRQQAAFQAASGYWELARASAAWATAGEAVRVAEEYSSQVGRAVEAGVAFPGDRFRTEVQVQRNRVLQRQAEEQRRVAAARLAETLGLAPSTDLVVAAADLAPVVLFGPETDAATLARQAVQDRPELRQAAAAVASLEADRRGVVRGPWIPSVGAQAFLGGLGGGQGDHLGGLGDSEEYFLGLSWRVGPGGLLDRGRVRAAESRHRSGLLDMDRLRLEIQREVVEAQAHCRSLADQVRLTEAGVASAQELFRLSRERREFGVGAVLETVQAEQELTRTRLEYLQAVAASNQAQFALRRALGTALLSDPTASPSAAGKP